MTSWTRINVETIYDQLDQSQLPIGKYLTLGSHLQSQMVPKWCQLHVVLGHLWHIGHCSFCLYWGLSWHLWWVRSPDKSPPGQTWHHYCPHKGLWLQEELGMSEIIWLTGRRLAFPGAIKPWFRQAGRQLNRYAKPALDTHCGWQLGLHLLNPTLRLWQNLLLKGQKLNFFLKKLTVGGTRSPPH